LIIDNGPRRRPYRKGAYMQIQVARDNISEMGCLDLTIAFNALIIVMVFVCDFVVTLCRKLGRFIVLEDCFGLTNMCSSINVLNIPVKKMGCVDITNVFNVLIIVMILVCYFLVTPGKSYDSHFWCGLLWSDPYLQSPL
jgi:hypothetical protein